MSPDERLWRVLRGFISSWALVIAVQLRVADELADGPRTVEELASRVGAIPDLLYRLLRVLATEGVFVEREPRTFANTDVSERLRHDGGGWAEAVATYDAVLRGFTELPHAVRTGDPPFQRAFGIDYWAWLARNPEDEATFNRFMQHGVPRRVQVLGDVEWRDGDTVVDVGGGNGTLMVELLRKHPNLHGIVLERPEVAAEAERNIQAADLSDRCSVVRGSFFERVPSADAYVLARILHDWNDDAATEILRTIRAAAPGHARVLILDSVLDADGASEDAKWMDLVMLALVNGRERTADEWRALLASTGFTVVRTGEALVEAVPRGTRAGYP